MANNKTSIITQGAAKKAFVKQGVTYWECQQTKTLFCKPLEQGGKVGGIHEEGRNNKEDNITRINRIKFITGMDHPHVLDFGCGNGLFLKDLEEQGCKASGYDKYVEKFNRMATDVDCITLIEVVEHLTHPFKEINMMYDALKNGGKVYIESSFADWLTKDSDYINPEAGHCTIFSHAGLDELMRSKGFRVEPAINRNARVYSR